MGGFSAWHWIIVLVVAVILFGGRGKISGFMGDLAKGIKSFKAGMKEEPETPASQPEKVEEVRRMEQGAPQTQTHQPKV